MGNSTQLQSFVDRIERLLTERADITGAINEVKGQAKSAGYSLAVLNTVLKRRTMPAHKRDEMDAMINLYEADLGMLGGKPLSEAALRRLERMEEDERQAKLDLGDGGDAPINPDREALYSQAVHLVLRDRNPSCSYIQRRLQIGYNLAASLVERMEKEGVVGPANFAGRREILANPDDEVIQILEAVRDDLPPPPALAEGESADDEDTARRKGVEAAQAGIGILKNPYPARTEQRAAWEEGWCQSKGSNGMETPDTLKRESKPKSPKKPKPDKKEGGGE